MQVLGVSPTSGAFFFFAVKMALRIDYLYTAVCKANGKGFEEPFEVEGSF